MDNITDIECIEFGSWLRRMYQLMIEDDKWNHHPLNEGWDRKSTKDLYQIYLNKKNETNEK